MDGHWKVLLNSKGANDINRVVKLYSHMAWKKLIPDYNKKFAVSGVGSVIEKVTASLANDSTFGLANFPVTKSVIFDLSRITADNKVKAQWFDTTTGEYITVKNSLFSKINQVFYYPGK